jgi:TIR domain
MPEPKPSGDKLNVFIAYSRQDIDFADQLDDALQLVGFATGVDRHRIAAGEDWRARLGGLVRDADIIVFVLSPASATSEICAWEVDEAVRLNKRIVPVLCRPLDGERPPARLADLNYIFFYPEAKVPGSGFGYGLRQLVAALNADLDWLREHTRLLQRATEWEVGGRSTNRLLSGDDIAAAKAWLARRPKDAPEPTELHLAFLRASEDEERRSLDEIAVLVEERQKAIEENRRLVLELAAAKARVEVAERGGQHEVRGTTKIFISYRRNDSAGTAGRVHDRLEREFGRDLLFMDVDTVPLGANFVKVLRNAVSNCDILIAVIGPNWLDARDEQGNRRLDNPDDFVRIEIATALRRDIPVIPILVDGARGPSKDRLPNDVQEIASRNWLDVRHASFHRDMDRLVRSLKPSEMGS